MEYPMCELFKASSNDRQVIEEFFDWLEGQRLELCVIEGGEYLASPCMEKINDLLMRYCHIDIKELDKERRRILQEATNG